MSDQNGKPLTDDEVLDEHRRWLEQHKKAFRVAFDDLRKLWPPKNDTQWFVDTAYPVCAAHYAEFEKDGNDLGMSLMLTVYGYLDRMSVKLGAKEREQ